MTSLKEEEEEGLILWKCLHCMHHGQLI